MRRFVHRILSAAPNVGLAVMAIYFGSNGSELAKWCAWFVKKMHEPTTFWIALSCVAIYTVLWWLSSLESQSLASKLRERGLLAIIDQMQSFCNNLREQPLSDADAVKIIEATQHAHTSIQNWLRINIGEAAVSVYQSGNPTVGYSSDGEARNFARHVDVCVKNLTSLCERPDQWHSVKRKWWRPWDHVTRYKSSI